MVIWDLVFIPHVVGLRVWDRMIIDFNETAMLDKKIDFVTMFTISSQV
jgi:hypothetical protein